MVLAVVLVLVVAADIELANMLAVAVFAVVALRHRLSCRYGCRLRASSCRLISFHDFVLAGVVRQVVRRDIEVVDLVGIDKIVCFDHQQVCRRRLCPSLVVRNRSAVIVFSAVHLEAVAMEAVGHMTGQVCLGYVIAEEDSILDMVVGSLADLELHWDIVECLHLVAGHLVYRIFVQGNSEPEVVRSLGMRREVGHTAAPTVPWRIRGETRSHGVL